MAVSITSLDRSTISQEISHYLLPESLDNYLPFNTGLHSASENTMISLLGSPLMPLTTTDQPNRVSPLVKKLLRTISITENIVVTGIFPAVESLQNILSKAFEHEKELGHHFDSVLVSHDMLNVRLRKPTSGRISTKISNHSWGTAIDFKIIGGNFSGDTGHTIPKYIAALLPFFNQAGWYSGIAFHDTMHFEVAEETIQNWQQNGLFEA